MEKARLILPDPEHIESYIEACREYKASGSAPNAFHDPDTIESWRDTLFEHFEDARQGRNLPEGYVPCTTFWLVEDGEVVAVGSLRHSLTPALERFGGHIGYAVRPSRRNQGYGTLLLTLLAREAQKKNIDSALITCDADNYPSARVMEKNGALYLDTVDNAAIGKTVPTKRYLLDTTDTRVDIVKDFYDANSQVEWDRLGGGRFEFEITRRALLREIKPGQRVLDVGGGPGRYSMMLAEYGCDVTLVDLSDGNVAFAKVKADELGLSIRALQGDARAVDTLVEGMFDHVLLMGPLYHLTEESDRVKAVKACMRLLKPGGLLFASFIMTYGGMNYLLKEAPQLLAGDPWEREFMQLVVDGKPYTGQAFTQAYFAHAWDIAPFMDAQGLERVRVFGQESILCPNDRTLMEQPESVRAVWLDYAEMLCDREEFFAMSDHLMYVGRKPG